MMMNEESNNRRNLIQPIEKVMVHESVVSQIRQLIAAKRLRPGDKLFSERELAEMLQVSRASVREAIKVLSVLGLVTIRPYEGIFVGGEVSRFFSEPMAQLVIMEESDFLSLFEARETIEIRVAELAAIRAEERDITALRMAIDMMQSASGTQELIDADLAFHINLAKASNNLIFCKLIEVIKEMMIRVQEELVKQPGVPARAIEQHRQILESIIRHDAVAAAENMKNHLSGMRAQTLRSDKEASTCKDVLK